MSDSSSKLGKKSVSILGCGWLGIPLAQRLLTSESVSVVKGSTTSTNKLTLLRGLGIIPFQLGLTPELEGKEEEISSFFDCDVLLISIPPGLRRNPVGYHLQQIEAVISRIKQSPISQVLYISSTGVYPDTNRVMVESDVILPEQAASPEMVAAENALMSLRGDRQVGILRFGGLLGYDRIPGKYVRGKKGLTTYHTPVNYIHQDDAVGIAQALVERGIDNSTYNAVAPIHSLRGKVYESSCAQFGWEVPTFSEPPSPEPFKIISAEKLVAELSYDFQYPDPLSFYYELEKE
ncbi:hypothetical protein [Dyadobacter tibetensis]|uniref:hypothetical protein n=1 Tax=Dyadobacter tibetensis TaxID=1211851 RepID=UPI0004718380|nr:hypothetical protein [Dyadobacter tibetensis]